MRWLTVAVFLASCEQKNPFDPKNQPPPGPPPEVVGVDPDKFDCKAFLPEADVSAVAMGKVEWVMSGYPPAPGRPQPCNYLLETDPSQAWGISFDCRERGATEAEAQMATKQGLPDTRPLTVGKKAIDHSKAQLIFLDDDTPCAVWIVGPTDISRAALARMVAAKLTMKTAPMTPRAASRR